MPRDDRRGRVEAADQPLKSLFGPERSYITFAHPGRMQDRAFAVVVSLFLLLLGTGCGLVFSYGQPALMQELQAHLDHSPLNRTYTAVEETVTQGASMPPAGATQGLPGSGSPGFRAPGAAVLILLGNNLLIAGALAFGSRLFAPAYAAALTSYILFLNGAVTASIFLGAALQASFPFALAAMAPHGIVEGAGIVLAGALGYVSLMDRRIRILTWFVVAVVPLRSPSAPAWRSS